MKSKARPKNPTVAVRLPPNERDDLKLEASVHGYRNLSDYLRELIHAGRTRQLTQEMIDGELLSYRVQENVETAVQQALRVHFAAAMVEPVEQRLRPLERRLEVLSERLESLPSGIEAQVRNQVAAQLAPTLEKYAAAFETQRTRIDGMASTVTSSMTAIGRSLENITGKLNLLLPRKHRDKS